MGTQSPKFSAHVYYSYCDFVRTLHGHYWFVQVQVQVFGILCILFLESLIVLSLLRYAHCGQTVAHVSKC